jgi:acetyl-CoA C-acetyltransferase
MSFEDIVLSSGVRTPFGDFGKVAARGAAVVAGRARGDGLPGARRAWIRTAVDHLVFGNTAPVDHDGLFVSRRIALDAGLPVESAALGVVRACGTGSQAIVSAAQQIVTGHSRVAVAAGGENFSRVPYLSHEMRWGAGAGRSNSSTGSTTSTAARSRAS